MARGLSAYQRRTGLYLTIFYSTSLVVFFGAETTKKRTWNFFQVLENYWRPQGDLNPR